MTEREPVDARTYARIFEGNADGRAIMDELTAIFAGALYVPDDKGGERETCRRLGRFEVVNFINSKIAAAEQAARDEQEQQP